MRLAIFIGAALAVTFIPTTSPPSAQPTLSKDEIDCQSKLFDAAQSFVSDKLEAIVNCGQKNGKCNEGKRDNQIARAADRLARTIGRECRNITFENLGFPGQCTDTTGGVFTGEDVASCLADQLETFVDNAVALAFPGGVPPQLSGSESKCQNTIGGQARLFINRKLRARTRCLELQLKGKIASDVDCLAAVPPGTGDNGTDKAIAQAINQLNDKIRRGCRNADLAGIGFPGGCTDTTGGDFTLADLQTCLETQLETTTDQVAALVFPLIGPQPTPTETPTGGVPTPTETPTVETPTPTGETPTATPSASPTEVGVTATETPGPGVTPTETPGGGVTATQTPGPGATPTETPGGGVTATETPGAGVTATETPGPGVTATETPGPGVTPTETPGAGATPTETLTPTPGPSPGGCPAQITFVANGSAADLDTGWTGQSHDNRVINNGQITVDVTGCTNSVADVTGPAPNAGGTGADNPSNNRRCVSATWVPCSSDADCSGFGNSCVFFFGAPLPLSSGGVSVCVVNQVTGTLTGTVNISTGDAVNSVSLASHVFNGPTLAQPCPICGTGGFGSASSCSGGPRNGNPCVVNGTSDLFGSTSFDCPPDPGALIANLNVPLTLSTGAQSRTLTDASPTCTATGFTSAKCFCDTCANAAATACSSNADCNGAVCGGKRCIGGTSAGSACTTVSDCPGTGTACGRPGKTTAPNECDDGMCSANPADTDSVNEGQCEAGPFEQFCNIERFRGCTSDANCTAPNDTCSFGKNRECYTDNGVVNASVQVQGNPEPFVGGVSNGTLGSFFCVGPTTAPAVNGVAGLPGLGRLTLPGTATLIP